MATWAADGWKRGGRVGTSQRGVEDEQKPLSSPLHSPSPSTARERPTSIVVSHRGGNKVRRLVMRPKGERGGRCRGLCWRPQHEKSGGSHHCFSATKGEAGGWKDERSSDRAHMWAVGSGHAPPSLVLRSPEQMAWSPCEHWLDGGAEQRTVTRSVSAHSPALCTRVGHTDSSHRVYRPLVSTVCTTPHCALLPYCTLSHYHPRSSSAPATFFHSLDSPQQPHLHLVHLLSFN